MKEKKALKSIIGIACVAILILVAVLGLYLDSQSPDPILGIFPPKQSTEETGTEQDAQNATAPDTPTDDTQAQSTDPSGETQPDTTPTNPSNTNPTLPADDEPIATTPENPTLPCVLEEYGLVIEKLASYQGMYVEDGSNAADVQTAMLMVHNNSTFPVEYTQLSVRCGEETLTFDISALPAGARVVVQEKTGKSLPEDQLAGIEALVVQKAELDMSEDKIRVKDNGNNTLTIENLTDETIQTVRVFYKHYMQDEDIYVGGIAFTVRITRLSAGASVTVQPSHYTSSTSRVVMALTYDSEV